MYRLLNSKGITDKNSIEDQEKIKTVLDSIFRANPFYIKLFSSKDNYWIIDKDNNIRYGPLTKQEFKNNLATMKIDLGLKKKE